MESYFVYITTANHQEAETIAQDLVAKRLVACANILPSIQSYYWWEGKVQKDSEVVLVAKTTSNKVDDMIIQVKSLHSYDCPCIIALPIEKGSPEYLNWLISETRS